MDATTSSAGTIICAKPACGDPDHPRRIHLHRRLRSGLCPLRRYPAHLARRRRASVLRPLRHASAGPQRAIRSAGRRRCWARVGADSPLGGSPFAISRWMSPN